MRLVDRMRAVARVLHGVFPQPMASGSSVVNPTTLIDVYRGTVDGRSVTVGNLWVAVESVNVAGQRLYGQGFCAVELNTLLVLVGIEPRSKHQAFEGVEIPTGDVAFDAAFRAVGLNALAAEVCSIQSCASECSRSATGRSSHTGRRSCPSLLASRSAPPRRCRAEPVRCSVLSMRSRHRSRRPRPTTRSMTSSPASTVSTASRKRRRNSSSFRTPIVMAWRRRQRLSRRFADVRTRDDIVTRFLSLPESDRRQILAMFDKATGA